MSRAIGHFIQRAAWAMYLGGALTAVGLSPLTWQFYVILVPVAVLETWAEGTR